MRGLKCPLCSAKKLMFFFLQKPLLWLLRQRVVSFFICGEAANAFPPTGEGGLRNNSDEGRSALCAFRIPSSVAYCDSFPLGGSLRYNAASPTLYFFTDKKQRRCALHRRCFLIYLIAHCAFILRNCSI